MADDDDDLDIATVQRGVSAQSTARTKPSGPTHFGASLVADSVLLDLDEEVLDRWQVRAESMAVRGPSPVCHAAPSITAGAPT